MAINLVVLAIGFGIDKVTDKVIKAILFDKVILFSTFSGSSSVIRGY